MSDKEIVPEGKLEDEAPEGEADAPLSEAELEQIAGGSSTTADPVTDPDPTRDGGPNERSSANPLNIPPTPL